jgi:protein tyrosine phosphatase (PTP) superfamily phosphohydrolase (DUF442 family)
MTAKTKWWRHLLTGIAVMLFALLSVIGWSHWHGNYHMVRQGELYRSGQLSTQQLAQHIESDGIRSIINLRGPAAGDDWYDEEVSLAQSRGVNHVDFDLSSSRPLDQQQMDSLVSLLKQQPKPLLIHCLGGADRTGLASALYLYAVKGEAAAQATKQLSVRYGHFPYLFRSQVAAMDDSFTRYVTASDRPAPDSH